MVYKVKESDLKGCIEYFPIEIVQKMVERQYEQINKCDVCAFQFDKCAGTHKGFIWSKTVEGDKFWQDIIMNNNFNLFFAKYPRHHCYIKRTSETKINDIITKLVSLGGKSIYKDYIINDIYYIDPVNQNIESCGNVSHMVNFLETFYTEAFVDTIYEYTMDEIAEKLGIDVKQLKIKK